jgi:hypothetical protein
VGLLLLHPTPVAPWKQPTITTESPVRHGYSPQFNLVSSELTSYLKVVVFFGTLPQLHQVSGIAA